MTRLRIDLFDNNKIDIDALSDMEAVLNTQVQNGQLQVVIGPAVANWYDEMVQITGIGGSKDDSDAQSEGEKKGFFSRILEILSNIFVPIIPAIAAAGMMKALLGLLTTFHWLSEESDLYTILNLMADTTFYFLPFLLAISAAKLFKTSEILSAVLAGALLYPSIVDMVGEIDSYSFLGLPIPVISYTTSVIPIILSVWLMSYVYRFVDKHMPDMLKVIFVPTVVLLVMIPIELIALGPLGHYFGVALSTVSMELFEFSGAVAGAILGGLRPLMVITGMHQALTPIVFQNFASLGYDVLMPTMIISTFAQATGVLTLALKSTSKKEKSVIYSSGISAILGITEPALYGVIIRYKRVLLSVIIGGALGAGYVSFMGYHLLSFAPSNIISLAVYALAPKFIHVIIGIIITVGSTFILVMTLQPKVGVKHEQKKAVNEAAATDGNIGSKSIETGIHAPMNGKLVDLTDVPDTTFSSGSMGDGFAIIPSEGAVVAPFDGTVIVTAGTSHAIGLRSESGIEVLIHIGIDTVELEGKYFNMLVQQGDSVKSGQQLITFNLEAIQKEYNIISPIIVTNASAQMSVNEKEFMIKDHDLIASSSL
ncbi:glucose PTS transporter subunit IIA [Virgibacillus sp. NKC19-3]|nr:glucose PTS transporter subunit IIA [Virgibacillus sp. NKC19-3]